MALLLEGGTAKVASYCAKSHRKDLDRRLRRFVLIGFRFAARPMAAPAQRAPIAAIAAAGGHVLPPAPMQVLVEAPPRLSINPRRDLLAGIQAPSNSVPMHPPR